MLALPIAILAVAAAIALTGMLLTFIGLDAAGTTANAAYSRLVETLFAPTAVPTYVPRLAVLAALVAVVAAGRGIIASTFSRPREASHRGTGWLAG